MTDTTPAARPDAHPPLTRAVLAVLLALALLAIAARLLPQPRTIDDAFITFRYSRNIVDGEGFVYNPGTRTLGTTTPLYTLWMAALSGITGSQNFPWLALATNALADAATTALLALLAYRVTQHLAPAVILGALWAISPMSVTFAIGGMETSVAILWLVAAHMTHVWQRPRLTALFAALGVLTRIDSLIWVGPLLLHQFALHVLQARTAPASASPAPSWLPRALRWLPWQSWLIAALVLLPWYAFSLVYFDTLFSNSLSAKSVAYVVEDLQALVRLLQNTATPFFEHRMLGIPGIAIGIFLYPALAAIGTLFAVQRYPRLLPFLTYPWVYIAVFSAMNPQIFRWYLAPYLPAYFAAILFGVFALAEAATRDAAPRRLTAILAAAGLVFGVLSLNAWDRDLDHGPQRPAPNMAWHEVELYYRDMAHLLRSEYGVTDETLVAAGDIGAVGYYSRARILDTVGLVTPELSDYYPLDPSILIEDANYAVPPAIVFDYEPDYIVFMEMFVRNGLALDARFDALYQQIAFIPTDFYGDGMILYQRRDLAANPTAP